VVVVVVVDVIVVPLSIVRTCSIQTMFIRVLKVVSSVQQCQRPLTRVNGKSVIIDTLSLNPTEPYVSPLQQVGDVRCEDDEDDEDDNDDYDHSRQTTFFGFNVPLPEPVLKVPPRLMCIFNLGSNVGRFRTSNLT